MPKATSHATPARRRPATLQVTAFSPTVIKALMAAHPDAALFKAAARYRRAAKVWDEMYGRLLSAQKRRNGLPTGVKMVADRLRDAEKELVAMRPQTPEGASAMLAAAAVYADGLPACCALAAAAIQGAVAVGL
jgi:hypothetical protein